MLPLCIPIDAGPQPAVLRGAAVGDVGEAQHALVVELGAGADPGVGLHPPAEPAAHEHAGEQRDEDLPMELHGGTAYSAPAPHRSPRPRADAARRRARVSGGSWPAA